MEQIPSALSAWARSPLAGLKSQRPARELTEFHIEARNRGTSCLSLTACPTLALICRRLVHSCLSCLSGCVYVFEIWTAHVLSSFCVHFLFFFYAWCCSIQLILKQVWFDNWYYRLSNLLSIFAKTFAGNSFSHVRTCYFSQLYHCSLSIFGFWTVA